jgi:hypothetical protein
MGSKKEVKDYLNIMRQEVCKGHLENIYGKDKAEKFVDEVENGIQSRGAGEDEYLRDNYQDYGAGVAQRLATLESSEVEKEDESNARRNSNPLPAARKDSSSDDDDDENEASFDDVAPSQIVARQMEQEAVPVTNAVIVQGSSSDNIDNGLDEAKTSYGNELEEPRQENDIDELGADDDSLEEPSRNEPEKALEEPVAERQTPEIPTVNDDEEDSAPSTHDVPITTQDVIITQDVPITQDVEVNTGNTGIVEFSQSQVSMFGETHTQEIIMTQDTMVFDASQTQEATQDTLIVDASQTQHEEMTRTQDTLVFDSSQDTGGGKDMHQENGSQDY